MATYFLKYSREFERESDLLGAQILARAGYDPREMAAMFKTLEAQGGSRAPEWLSTHPNPGNRYETITREAELLRVENRIASSPGFASLQARLRSLPPAQSAQQVQRAATTGTAGRTVSVEPPSPQYREVQADVLRLAVPSNWQQDSTEGHLTFAPAGALVRGNGTSAFTHGVQVGVVRTQAPDLTQGTQELIDLFARSNPQVRTDRSQHDTMSGRAAVTTRLRNISEVTGRPERIDLSTTQLRGGSLLYVLAVAPEAEAGTYDNVFRRVRQSLQIQE